MVHITRETIEAALQLGLPEFDAEDARSRISPSIRPYERDPEQAGEPRYGATLLLVYPAQDQLHFILTRRPESLRSHAGQISLPGGRREQGEDFQTTALRETCEELGVCEPIQLIGPLMQLYILPSDYYVQPFVGYLPERPIWQVNEAEVAEIIETPLTILLDDTIKGRGVGDFRGVTFDYGWYEIQGHRVWGATAIMLSEMEGRLRHILGLPFSP